MANQYFQFKQFMIHQHLCAMKVTTDACLFGAVMAEYLKEKSINTILDVGTGTGLLSLMLAQQTKATIDAVEIDSGAAKQAHQNFEASIWKNRLQLYHTSIQNYQSNKQHDCIICNPPFFERDLKSSNQQKNLALHSTQLNFQELIEQSINRLSANGYFAVLLPFTRSTEFEQMMGSLQLQQKILIKQTPTHNYFRSILIYGTGSSNHNADKEIIIKDNTNDYSEDFKQLLSPYYLHL